MSFKAPVLEAFVELEGDTDSAIETLAVAALTLAQAAPSLEDAGALASTPEQAAAEVAQGLDRAFAVAISAATLARPSQAPTKAGADADVFPSASAHDGRP